VKLYALILLILNFHIFATCSGSELISSNRQINVLRTRELVDAFESGANVFACIVIKRIPDLSSDENIERGVVTLKVTQTLRGVNRENISIPYSFVKNGATYVSSELVWPNLDNLKNSNLVCVVLSNAVDFTAYLTSTQSFNEAASGVFPSDSNDNAKIAAVKRICAIYDAQDSAQLAKELRKAIFDNQQMVVDFALQVAALKLSRSAPDEAVQIIQSRVVRYSGDIESLGEAQRFASYIETKFGQVDPRKPMNQFFARSMVTLAKSSSLAVKKVSINGLAHLISKSNHIDDFSLKAGLSSQEIGTIREIINEYKREHAVNSELSELQIVDTWLGP
jgi:hypothetical protein